MMQEVPMSREEKIEMYMAMPKEQIASMLVECNRIINARKLQIYTECEECKKTIVISK